MEENETKPKLIISKKPKSDNMSESSSIGDTCFRQQYERNNCVKSKSEYSLNGETGELTELWTPLLGSTVSLEFDCESDCSSCNDLLAEIKLHKYFKIGNYYRPADIKRTQSLPNLKTHSPDRLNDNQSNNSSSVSSIFSIQSE